MENNNNIIIIPGWDEWFIKMTYLIASKSKDKSSKIGSVLVRDTQIISTGYNGFPMGVNDDIPDRHEKPKKYHYVVHAEVNCLYLAARNGGCTNNCTIYTNVVSCVECTKGLINAGIKKLIYHKQCQEKLEEFPKEQWQEQKEIVESMLNEAKIDLVAFDKVLNQPAFIRGKQILV
jgi:dCMP deaminase